MNAEILLEYIRRRMRELGHGDNYLLKMRHLVLAPTEERTIAAENEYFYLAEEEKEVTIESSGGFYDLTATVNELQYEHQGRITLTNNHPANPIHLKFIQIIPKR